MKSSSSSSNNNISKAEAMTASQLLSSSSSTPLSIATGSSKAPLPPPLSTTTPSPKLIEISSALDFKEQSPQERYGEPENYLEIEVKNPQFQGEGGSKYVDYEIICETNLPLFKQNSSRGVRRRYRDFEWLKNYLERSLPRVNIPALPGKVLFSSTRFQDDTIEGRRQGLERFLQVVAGHPLVQTGSRVIVPFIQDPNFNKDDYSL